MSTEHHVAPGRSGWYGWFVYAGTMMVMLGAFHAVAGVVALINDEYFLVTSSGLLVTADFTSWGWVHLALGVVILLAGVALSSGVMWARVAAVAISLFSSLVNLAFLPAYPVWSMLMIALDVLVIYAVTAHGDAARVTPRG